MKDRTTPHQLVNRKYQTGLPRYFRFPPYQGMVKSHLSFQGAKHMPGNLLAFTVTGRVCGYSFVVGFHHFCILAADDGPAVYLAFGAFPDDWAGFAGRGQKAPEFVLSGVEFLRRFCQHIVPKRFVRIRHYGLLSCAKRKLLREIRQALPDSPATAPQQPEIKAKNPGAAPKPDICPHCKTGTMIRLAEWCKGRAPPELINSLTICTPV